MGVSPTIKRDLGDNMEEKLKYWVNVHEDIKKYLDKYFEENGDSISITELNNEIKKIEWENLKEKKYVYSKKCK